MDYKKILEDVQARKEAEENARLEAERLEAERLEAERLEAERKAKEEAENRSRRIAELKEQKIKDTQFYLQFNGELLAVYEGIYEKLDGLGDEVTELMQKQLEYYSENYPGVGSIYNTVRKDMKLMRESTNGLSEGYKARIKNLKAEIEKNVLFLYEAGKLPKSPKR